MMNLYRDQEPIIKYKKNIIDDIKLSLATSFLNRVIQLRKVKKLIKEVDYKDTEKLKLIKGLISKYDLTDPRFGKTLKKDTVIEFKLKLQSNARYQYTQSQGRDM